MFAPRPQQKRANGGQEEQGEDGRGDKPTNDDGSKRPLDLGAGAGCNRHRHETKRSNKRRHQDRSQPFECTLKDSATGRFTASQPPSNGGYKN